MSTTLKNEFFLEIDQISEGQYNSVAKRIVMELVEAAKDSTKAGSNLRDDIEDAIDFLYDLREALNMYKKKKNENNKFEELYNVHLIDDCLHLWKAVKLLEPISMGYLQRLLSRYVKSRWFSPTIEWVLINSYLSIIILEETKYYINNCSHAGEKWSVRCSKNETIYSLLYFILYHCYLDRVILLFFPIAIALFLFFNNWLITCIIFSVFMMFSWSDKLLTMYAKFKNRKNFSNIYCMLIDAKNYTSHFLWSPRLLKEKLESINKSKSAAPELIPILDKIIKRDAETFTISPETIYGY